MNSSKKQIGPFPLWQMLRGAIVHLANYTDVVPSDDVHVWKSQRPNGRLQWKVYNASVRQFEHLNSETEVMEWIEESYHHTGDAARQFWFFL